MKIITVNDIEYKLEYDFAAAEDRAVVAQMFDMLSMAPVFKNVDNPDELENGEAGNAMLRAIIEGQVEMTGKIPSVAMEAFYAGLLEHHENISKKESRDILKQYMKDNDYSFQDVFNELTKCMEDDGFFKLTGIEEKIESMSNATQEKAQKIISKNPEKVIPIKNTKKSPSKKSSTTTE